MPILCLPGAGLNPAGAASDAVGCKPPTGLAMQDKLVAWCANRPVTKGFGLGMKRVAACMKHSRLISHKERRNVPMKKGYRASGLMVLLFFRAAVSRQTPGRPVAISNKFASAVRVGIQAAARRAR